MEGLNFVLVCNPLWELKIGSNIRNIALELSKKNKVLYVNPPLDRKTALTNSDNEDVIRKKKVLKGELEDLRQISDNLWLLEPRMLVESINWIPFTSIFKRLNKKSSKKYAKCIKSGADRIGFDNYIIMNDSLMFRGFDLKELLQPQLYIYYIRDYLMFQPYFKRHGQTMEPELMKKSDLVLANSVFLAKFASRYNKDSYYVGQGYESKFFNYEDEQTIPDDLLRFEGPLVGYIGTLTSFRLDLQLIHDVAVRLSDHQFIMIGPEDPFFTKGPLENVPNVHFLGLRPMNQLAAYLKHFDVCINPQLVNDQTIGNYPLKIDEYLSMGKPTVATKTEAMEAFSEFTYLASGSEEFAEMIIKAKEENTEKKEKARHNFTRGHTWENCIAEIYKRIEQKINPQSQENSLR